MANFIILTKGTGGDFVPFLYIGSLLKQRNHNVVFATHSHYETETRAMGFDFTALDTVDEYQKLMSNLPLSNSPLGLINYCKKWELKALSAEYAIVRSLCRNNETAILANPVTVYILAKSVAEGLKIPLISVYYAPFFAKNIFLQEGIYRFIGKDINKIRTRLGLKEVYNWNEWMRKDNHFIGLWPSWFARHEQEWPAPFTLTCFPVNSIDKEEISLPTKVDQFLAKFSLTILITHGTSFPISGDFFNTTVNACKQLAFSAIIVTPHTHLVPSNLPSNFCLYESLPFNKIMHRMAAVIHHGGMGTTTQALYSGIPQLIPARGFDRPDNAHRVQAFGVGEYLPPIQWTTEGIADGLYRVLRPEVLQRCKEMSKWIRNNFNRDIPETIECVLDTWKVSNFNNEASGVRQFTSEYSQKGVNELLKSLSNERLALLTKWRKI